MVAVAAWTLMWTRTARCRQSAQPERWGGGKLTKPRGLWTFGSQENVLTGHFVSRLSLDAKSIHTAGICWCSQPPLCLLHPGEKWEELRLVRPGVPGQHKAFIIRAQAWANMFFRAVVSIREICTSWRKWILTKHKEWLLIHSLRYQLTSKTLRGPS